jgi:hypothetical protein
LEKRRVSIKIRVRASSHFREAIQIQIALEGTELARAKVFRKDGCGKLYGIKNTKGSTRVAPSDNLGVIWR